MGQAAQHTARDGTVLTQPFSIPADTLVMPTSILHSLPYRLIFPLQDYLNLSSTPSPYKKRQTHVCPILSFQKAVSGLLMPYRES